jgi:hypothetical protein
MNSLSGIERRTKIVLGLLGIVGLVAVASSVMHAFDSRPELEITFSHFGNSGDNGEYRYAVMEIRNVGNAPARFYGYSPEVPDCELVQKDENGLWQNRILRCGDGLSPQLMFPGEQISTTNYLPGNDPWKLGLRYTKPAFRDRLPARVQKWLSFLPMASAPPQQVWSLEFPPAKIGLVTTGSSGAKE